MRNTTPPKDFEIHVDPSCLSDGSNTHDIKNEKPAEEPSKLQGEMSPERVSSNQTVVHHDSWGEEEIKAESPGKIQEDSTVGLEEEHKENVPSPHVEPHNATVEDVPEDEEDLQQHCKQDKEDEKERVARERQLDRIEAQIQAAARAVVASIEQDNYRGGQDSELSMQTDESYDREGTEMTYDGSDLTYGMGTELTYGDETEATYESDHDDHSKHEEEADPTYGSQTHSDHEGGDTSSNHDGDIDDDVFSHSDRSKRSSMNSDLHSSDDNQKILTSPVVGEEAGSANEMDTISRVPSSSSYMQTPVDMSSRNPSKILARPPFRTPSSVRAMQMSSPTQSVFGSPRSAKRHMPTVSRIGTPNSQYSPSKRTPTRFKPKKEPLVLLHVTVLPLQWPYSHLMSSPEIPASLQTVKESWRLLQEKLGDTVLERGILLPHPQDSYEVLEERLLEALELPVRPRAKILKCGHYMGPSDSEAPSSDEEGDDNWGGETRDERKWCDICMRDVRLETVGEVGKGERRFRVKIYASNGLMRAGAWAAAWREMERVDVELEPYVEMHLNSELEHLALLTPLEEGAEQQKELDDGFEDEEPGIEHVHDHEAEKRREEEDRRHDEQTLLHDEEQMRKQMAIEEELRQKMVEEEEMMQRKAMEDEMMHRKVVEEERMREIYGTPEPSASRRSSSRTSVHDDSTLPELLLAAFKVAMRDSKNVAIGILSVLVLFLALKPKSVPETGRTEAVMEAPSPAQVTTTVFKELLVTDAEPASMIDPVVKMVTDAGDQESILPVTTTVFRELTVTERIPMSTSIDALSDSPGKVRDGNDPCETPIKEKSVDAEPVVNQSDPMNQHVEVEKAIVLEPKLNAEVETPAADPLSPPQDDGLQIEESQNPLQEPADNKAATLSAQPITGDLSDESPILPAPASADPKFSTTT
ncbi:hypothetical protein ONS95_000334 [Cadophora gregata]|uniref:uncharacterized protein n=1 Tax=Cadophora gregata TaxID=51156 RepID=UPI0026DD4044|nr:uncharacterized protein ONS95_000334 [Cadophora gregata]KAK0125663.1 hypothetical protein ONS96_009496 [Cadophora gregata f. sp. sojae]KAK0128362.1 hypothetical protein ONS95_000334 [Cadophora gregata]